jgi:hypothetical protein
MRITRELLLNIARETVEKRVQEDERIIAAYLHGILTSETPPLLGGTADIDLAFIYEEQPDEREIVRLTDEVYLDIYKHGQERYKPARKLREDAWLGAEVYYAEPLYDPNHFLDFTQASVRGMFDEAANVAARSAPQFERARQTWFSLYNGKVEAGVPQVKALLSALEDIANGVACLTGPPLTERRFLLEFPQRAGEAGNPGLMAGLVGLLGAANLDAETIKKWLPGWTRTYELAAALPEAPPKLRAPRKIYYLRAIETMLDSNLPAAGLWPLMKTWTPAVGLLPPDVEPQQSWVDACDELSLLGDHFASRVEGLDAYLDTVEELFRKWKSERGL